jgi:hypothetical protein
MFMSDSDDPITLAPWYASKTTWVLIATKVVFVLNILGVAIEPKFADTFGNFMADGAVIVGIVVSAYLHWKAKRGIVKEANAVISDLQAKQ